MLKRGSQFEGVQWSMVHAKWHAHCREDGRYVDLGLFQAEEDAARAVFTAEFVSSSSEEWSAWPAHLPLKRARVDPLSSGDSDRQSGRSMPAAQRPTALALPSGESSRHSPPASSALTRALETAAKPRSRARIARPNSTSSTQDRQSPERPAVEAVKTKKQQSQFVGV
jgi:hypothetical protein